MLLGVQAGLLGLARAEATAKGRPNEPANEPTQARLELLTLDSKALAETRRGLAGGNSLLSAAHAALLNRANKALQQPLRSVIDKTMAQPSGSRNDYMSMGPYWWPNPKTANGLPYVRRDGERNPEVAGDALDAERMQAFCRDVLELSLAHHFGAPDRYAEKAAAALQHWFLRPASRMTPHLRYAQGIPGIVDGRAEGLIDTRNLWMVIDAALMLNRRGAFSDADLAALKTWFTDFVQWMRSGSTAREEDAADNNHGMFFDAQFVNYLLFIGETQEARARMAALPSRRIRPQIEEDGRMPHELARTRPFHYSVFNLEALTRLAQYGRMLGADLWQDPRLQRAIDFLEAAALSPETWRHATSTEQRPEAWKLLPILLMARGHTGADRPLLNSLVSSRPTDLDWLLWPMAWKAGA